METTRAKRKWREPQLLRQARAGAMPKLMLALMALVLGFALPVRAIDQAKPGEGAGADPHAGMQIQEELMAQARAAEYAKQNRAGFESQVRLDEFRMLAIQHMDQVKIMDSWARQSLRKIRHRDSIGGKDPVLAALDMALRPEAWMDKNIIYVESVPIREELGQLSGSVGEARRIRDEALVSPAFLISPQVMARMQELGQDSRQMDAVNKVFDGLSTFLTLVDGLHIVPPTGDRRSDPWVHPGEIMAAESAGTASATGSAPASAPARATALPPYSAQQKLEIQLAMKQLITGWQANDASLANQGISRLVAVLPSIDQAGYPSPARREVELWYNRTFSGTLVALVYFVATVLFFLTALGIAPGVRRTALITYGLALACHVAAMAIRWWLNGRIPIQNQFESVMGSACIGCCIGLGLELWRRKGIFGAAFAFLGFLSTTTLLASPYVFGRDLGSAPGKVAGILTNTAWLYIHVNIVIASYGLIFASAVIGGLYLWMTQWYWVNPVEPGYEVEKGPGGEGGVRTQAALAPAQVLEVERRRMFLETLDQANMVVLQMAMWMLGVGILCGAVWADQSWGRPWGWDPKETFALVTWIVYLVIVHVRLVIRQKAGMTALLAVVGCGVMLFNWIGVNFFLKGLHSYA